MSLTADVGVRVGGLRIDAALEASAGETVAILGPNGAGKTSVLRALAGLLPIARGRIELDGAVLDDGDRTFVPPERRSIGFVFQDYRLFPHLSALENVAFGLRARGTRRGSARAHAARGLARVGLGDRANARPRELSGGEAQRVALARALAIEPRLLLLDEPLAALDQSARSAVRRDLRSRLGAYDGVRLVVTHDPLDAAALADRLVVLEQGRVVQQGTFAEVSARPRSSYVADLVGVNLLEGRAAGGVVELPTGGRLVVADAGAGDVLVVVHPRAVAIHREPPGGSPRNVSAGTVRSIEPLGDRVRVGVAGAVPLVAEITAAALAELGLAEGAAVLTSVKATEVTVFPR
jgi:molybdate transport system ATP-binding protein